MLTYSSLPQFSKDDAMQSKQREPQWEVFNAITGETLQMCDSEAHAIDACRQYDASKRADIVADYVSPNGIAAKPIGAFRQLCRAMNPARAFRQYDIGYMGGLLVGLLVSLCAVIVGCLL